MTITSILALFVLLLISSATFFLAKRFKVPYTVLLVIVGLLLVPLSNMSLFGSSFNFLQEVVLTPELLFFVFLPMLIFESAFNMNMRKMIENAWHITLLSIVGLIISTVIIAGLLYGLFQLLGIEVPFIITLLFGAVISATDPVAVLALFKEYNAPKRLTLIFEGESLFNDGTAVALFLVILGVATSGFHGVETVIEGVGVFAMMVLVGIAFGVFMATVFSKALRYTRSNEFVSITLLIVSAHLVFILSELINTHPLFGLHIHVSPIIATTVSSLFLGTYARHILSPTSDEYLHKSIEHLAFIANSLVFLLAGLLFASTNIDFAQLWLPIALTIVIVAFARAISVYAITIPLNYFRPVSKIPGSWQKLLAWGSLRGALAIIVVLLIPDNFTIEGWSYAYSPKELLLALTIGCILATLFIKATTIGALVTKLGVNKPSNLQQAWTLHLGLYYLLTEKRRISDLAVRGFVDKTAQKPLLHDLQTKIDETANEQRELFTSQGSKLAVQSLHYLAIAIERQYLKTLYAKDEVTESVYRRIRGKLTLQQEKIEYAQHESINPSSYMDRKDVFERLVHFTQNAFSRSSTTPLEEQYLYYRTQSIIARKALKTLQQMQTQYDAPVFEESAFEKVIAIYTKHQDTSAAMLRQLSNDHADELQQFIMKLSKTSLHSTGGKALRFFKQKGLTDESTLELIDQQYSLN